MTTHLPPPEVELGDVGAIAEPAGLPPGTEPVARSNWQLFRRRFFRHKMAVVVDRRRSRCSSSSCFGANWLAPYPKNAAVTCCHRRATARPRRTGSAPTSSAATSCRRSCTAARSH